MYYLAKFCRICIQTGGELKDIDSTDHDSIKFSEKLKTCTQMVITRESLSTQICTSCITKLRVSYQFHSMCKKSTSILQQYLSELLKLPKPRRKRIGKDERCSLLRKLLSKVTQDQIMHNIHINGLTKLCDMISPTKPEAPPQKERVKHKKSGGLRSLLNFTKDYDFGYDINLVSENHKNVDLTPLEQLAKFTENFFCDHFLDYTENIVNIGDSLDSDFSDDEEMFDYCVTTDDDLATIKEELVIVEPTVNIKDEYFDETEDDSHYQSSRFVQAWYDDETNSRIKQEHSDENKSFVENITSPTFIEVPQLPQNYLQSNYIEQIKNFSDKFRKQRTLSPFSVKCRTRGNPFINPQLKKQFQTRNFKCTLCNRKFKSPGYLKAHRSRLNH